ncbi:hypothetical protein FMEXI_7502 [Fusarium mexicanum]|uniref:Uncharacterized protein n=1 Tax=Fusarium mexicanum TaxID=751941 RepID=A0A8H5MVS1_9HYPO|nr:hypothetical protein FMEXI_7502 [Fusarium mexicanum]
MPYVYKPWILKDLGVESWEQVRMMGEEGLREARRVREEERLRQKSEEKLKAEKGNSSKQHVSSETPVKEPGEKHDVLSGRSSSASFTSGGSFGTANAKSSSPLDGGQVSLKHKASAQSSPTSPTPTRSFTVGGRNKFLKPPNRASPLIERTYARTDPRLKENRLRKSTPMEETSEEETSEEETSEEETSEEETSEEKAPKEDGK